MHIIILLLSDIAVLHDYPDGVSLGVAGSRGVSMVAETVIIHQTSSDCKWFTAEVEASFTLHCNSQGPVNLAVGFPFQGFVWGQDRARLAPESLATRMNLSVAVDGKGVDLYYKRMPLDTTIWFACWGMDFRPGETRRVIVKYAVPWSYREHNFRYPEPVGGKHGSYSYSGYFTYIVSTGATWAGTIGDALIELELPTDCAEKVSISPAGYETSKRGASTWITWSFSAWEPDSSSNIKLEINTQKDY